MFIPDDVKNCRRKWEHSIATGELYEVEFRLYIQDHGYKWHLGRAVPQIRDGQIVKWFGTNTDIDNHKKAEEKKDEFISIASHELKTPLTNIKAFIQLAAKNLTTSRAAEFLEKAEGHISTCSGLLPTCWTLPRSMQVKCLIISLSFILEMLWKKV